MALHISASEDDEEEEEEEEEPAGKAGRAPDRGGGGGDEEEEYGEYVDSYGSQYRGVGLECVYIESHRDQGEQRRGVSLGVSEEREAGRGEKGSGFFKGRDREHSWIVSESAKLIGRRRINDVSGVCFPLSLLLLPPVPSKSF